MTVRTRFAPSPTGYLHIGGARTALYSWLHARHHGGQFVLRIEDTDLERSTPESVQAILEGMDWLELNWDEGPYYQTQRFDRYREVIQALLAENKAYRCYCTKEELEQMREGQRARGEKPRYSGLCRDRHAPREGVEPVIRFRSPDEGETVVDDLIHGRVVFRNSELDDLIIARGDGTPTYNFTVVVDDWDMAITHVIRGDDHLNNTPRQIQILQALGATPPTYAHVPMILGPDKQKMSKRHGAVSVVQYRDEGYLPEALLNYLVRLGWSHGDQEVFSMAEMIEYFRIENVNKAASVFNPEKLLWLNAHHIKHADPARLAERLRPFLARLGAGNLDGGPDLVEVVRIQQERARTLVEMAENSRFFYLAPTEYEPKDAAKHLNSEALPVIEALRERLGQQDDWRPESLHEQINALAEYLQVKLGKVAQPLRVALAGRAVSPPIDMTLSLLGKAETLARLDQALHHIGSAAD